MVTFHDIYSGLWVALLVLGVERFPREYGEARMLSAISRYRDICRDDPWAAEFLPNFQDNLAGGADAFKSALAWGYTAGFCWEDVDANEVVIEIDEDLYRNSLNHHGPDFHRVILEFAKAFSCDLQTVWD